MGIDRVKPYQMPFCERAFGTFFLVWGLILLAESLLLRAEGRFLGRMEHYAPTWAWGGLLIVVGVGRWIAYRRDLPAWRVRLSFVSFIILVVVAATALSAGLWSATTPLAAMLAYVALWCHNALLRDIDLGL